MGAVHTITVASTDNMNNGQRTIRGTAALSCSYATGGETFDISAYLSGSPTVVIGLSPTLPFIMTHDQGTAAAGKVMCFTTSNGSLSQGLSQVASTTNVASVTFTFSATGTAV